MDKGICMYKIDQALSSEVVSKLDSNKEIRRE